MAQLKLKALECIKTEDNSGADEPYLIVNGKKVWSSSSLNDGQTADLIGVPIIDFSSTAKIRLYEEDWPDGDDFLGEHIANASAAGAGEQYAKFGEDDADYELTYEVLA